MEKSNFIDFLANPLKDCQQESPRIEEEIDFDKKFHVAAERKKILRPAGVLSQIPQQMICNRSGFEVFPAEQFA